MTAHDVLEKDLPEPPRMTPHEPTTSVIMRLTMIEIIHNVDVFNYPKINARTFETDCGPLGKKVPKGPV